MNLHVFENTPLARIAPAITCVWIVTGNPRQPLACVWIDREVGMVLEPTGSTNEPVPVSEEHLGGLAA